jgi:hypothetical protein
MQIFSAQKVGDSDASSQGQDSDWSRSLKRSSSIVCSQVSIVNDSVDVLQTRTFFMKRSIGWRGRLPACWPICMQVRTMLRATSCALLATAFAWRRKGTQRSRGPRHGGMPYLVTSVGARCDQIGFRSRKPINQIQRRGLVSGCEYEWHVPLRVSLLQRFGPTFDEKLDQRKGWGAHGNCHVQR